MTTQEELEQQVIQQEFEALLDDYRHTAHRQKIDIITKAFNFAKQAHAGVRRRSGEPYIMHPLAVARIVVGEIGLGSTSICAALLHDVVEDTDYTVEDIEKLFTPKIAQIVDGLTKISGGVFGEKASEQAENFRKLLLTMSEDIRVILIKIADRLHNMRTLGSMPPEKQFKIAGETQYIYAPLAHRLGLFPIKTELEDLSFKYEHPNTYAEIEAKLAADKAARLEFYEEFAAPIKKKLTSLGYKFTMNARIKSVYSIWKKMSTRQIPFEEVYDVLAARIIFEPSMDMSEKDQCWMIYSAITEIYHPHPERIRDWISMPKSNGYEALHITVMGPEGQWVEVQIRTTRMHDIAEKGLAAHWKYKTGEQDDSELDKWLKTIKDLLQHPEPNAVDFMDTFKLNLFAQEIFVFTPKGDIITLPQNATALDFAFLLHTEIGLHCLGAKVNHKLVPLNYLLKGGDQVEIITSRKTKPQPEWLDYVTTAKAQSRLKAFFRRQRHDQEIKGEEMLNNVLQQYGYTTKQDAVIHRIVVYYHLQQPKELYQQIAQKNINLDNIEEIIKPKQERNFLSRIFSFGNGNNSPKEEPTNTSKTSTAVNPKSKKIILTESNYGTEYCLAPCCTPIPGDEVLGFRDENGMIVIHKQNCPEALNIKAKQGKRILNAQWDMHRQMTFAATIEIKGIDRIGLVIHILNIVSEQNKINIQEMKFEAEEGIFNGTLKVLIHDTEQLKTICDELKKIKEIKAINRLNE
ncbi:MAG: bifunctional (p)ppGpp synthetase/guanosine-3',5'-bis(diphosphate) 3'-pyrophosphohydrolase [Paludibacteraceae bacterium]|nr:bifunctional (p)ppGpp synthetase/guanosine-3',5'-bis(diphosphate) 3'-pyrophosphohydrolase [Paludibacteraceae bacterium]